MSNAIITAVYRKDFPALAKLLPHGDINCEDTDGRTPLMHAVLANDADVEMVKYLVANGADVNTADGDQCWTALHFSARDQRKGIVKALLDSGAVVDVTDAFGNTPLWRCVMAQRPNREIVHMLLERGADPGKKNQSGVSPKDIADTMGNDELLAILKQST